MASQVAKQVFASEVAAAEYAAATADRCCNLFMQSLGREEWLRDCAEADKRQAEEALVHERAARLVMEKLFAKEAAAADAAAAEARWRPAASRGGRGRGGRGRGQQHPQPQVQPQPPPATPPPTPPTPPPPSDFITLVLTVPIAHNGQMTPDEALLILEVTDKRPKWLLSQVHPDRHPGRQEEATQATARVNQAMDVRTRHVTEVFRCSL